MEPSIYRFILKHSLPQQLIVLTFTVVSWPVLYLSLELPKRIINEALGDSIGWARGLLGEDMDRITFLLVLCFAFLLTVALSGGLKYFMNVYAGRLGERMLRRLRYELYSRVLRFPLPHFKKVSQGEIIPMITSEVEPLGGFIGEAFSLPAFQGGMLLVYLGFIFAQNFFLGLAAIALYPLQMWLIPKLQKRVNLLAKERVRNVRYLADKIGESVSGVQDVHAHDTSQLERADISRRLDKIYVIRYEIFRRKFAIKFLNNFIAQLTPFFFYSIGGYLIITSLGKPPEEQALNLGALVAVLAAYKDLSSPWKELLRFYQLKEDVRIKYEQVIEQFAPPGMLAEELQDADVEQRVPLGNTLEASNVTFSEDGRVKTVEGVNFAIDLTQHTAIVGPGGSGKDELSMMLARLLQPSGGSIKIGDKRLDEMPEAVTGRQITYVGPGSYLFSNTVRENLYYGLKHKPVTERALEGDEKKDRQRYVDDAHFTGNSPLDFLADWVDFKAAGAGSREELDQFAVKVLTAVDMGDDMYQLGLRGTIDPVKRPELAAQVLEARAALRTKLDEGGAADLVEPFDEEAYNSNATLGENLLFGTPRDETFDDERLAGDPYVHDILQKVGLIDTLLQTGREVADTMVELFAGLPPGHEFFEQYSFISSDELQDYQPVLARTANVAPAEWREDDRSRLISLPFKLIPARHRLGLISDEIQDKVLEGRRLFRESLPGELADKIEFFDSESYNSASSLQDNILFGKVAYGKAQVQTKLNRFLGEVMESLSLREQVIVVGLDFHVGVAGSRLSGAQRQKLALARAIVKVPDLLVIDEGINNLDGAAQTRVVDKVLELFKGRGLIWSLHRAKFAEQFDKVLVMRSGKVIEQGTFAGLNKESTALYELLKSE